MFLRIVWRGCTLRVFAIGDNDSTKNEEIRKGLQKYIYMLRIDAELFMVNLLDLEVSEEVVEKTAELERRQQTIKNEIRRSRSRESGFTNEAYNNDDTISSRKLRLNDSVRSFTPIVININEDAETSFIDNPADGLYRPSSPSEESEIGDVKLNVSSILVEFNCFGCPDDACIIKITQGKRADIPKFTKLSAGVDAFTLGNINDAPRLNGKY
ncbi:hypothetical protein Y032_0559g3451 [Ancylostoma ceylanicum]|uniref:Uncharacterized protein n=1 Tax=Ancylostoma ceylanicum TaxID=53326 RepID=A0A016WRS0_9BILA|nr:hypothetical protein Y032_0559g3451 [Ancylostoma ceylanicum]